MIHIFITLFQYNFVVIVKQTFFPVIFALNPSFMVCV